MFCLVFVSSLASLETDGGGIRFTRTTEGNVTASLFLLQQFKFLCCFLSFFFNGSFPLNTLLSWILHFLLLGKDVFIFQVSRMSTE